MMHDKDHGYVIAIRSNGKVLREQHGCVYLPFYSEYAIRVKNTRYGRVGVNVIVDGTSITDDLVIVDSLATLDLERTLVDGNMDTGPALMFAPLSDSNVQDPTESENGTVRVEFFQEKTSSLTRSFDIPSTPFYKGGYSRGTGSNAMYGASFSSSNSAGASIMASTAANGATVEGKQVSQSFKYARFDCYSTPVVTLRLRLVGKEKPTYVSDTRVKYCTNCGTSLKKSMKFCYSCGAHA